MSLQTRLEMATVFVILASFVASICIQSMAKVHKITCMRQHLIQTTVFNIESE